MLPGYTHQLFVEHFSADYLEVFVLKVITETAVGCKNNTRLLCHGCNFVWPTTWLGDGEVTPSLHNAPFRLAVSEGFILLSLTSDTSLVSSLGYLSVPLSITCFLSGSSTLSFFCVCFFPPLCLSVKLLSFLKSDELLFPLLFLQWNTRSQPDGSSHKFQAACHSFCLGKRKRMHVWPTQQPLVLALGHAAAGKKKSFFRRAEH